MSYIKTLIFLILCVYNIQTFAQNDFEGLGETAFAINHKVNNNYKFNFSLKSRYYFYQDNNINFENRQVDFIHFSSLNLDFNHSISLGIQYRFRESIDDGINELRLTQQFNYTKKNNTLRFGHRVRFEQRILNKLIILRSRYRLAIDLPLNGEKLDIGESYLISSIETLLSKSNKMKPEFDYRTTVQIGWLASEVLKLQLGIEHRLESLNHKAIDKLFILTSFILKI